MMKNVLLYLPAFYLLVQTNFASKDASNPSSGDHLSKTKSGKFFALLSKKKNDFLVEVKSKTKTRNKKIVEAVNKHFGNVLISWFKIVADNLTDPSQILVFIC